MLMTINSLGIAEPAGATTCNTLRSTTPVQLYALTTQDQFLLDNFLDRLISPPTLHTYFRNGLASLVFR